MKRACILLVLISIIPIAALAQSPQIGRIALYADSLRTVNEVDLPAPYTFFDVYIFCQPSENGMYCAEFAFASSTTSMVVASSEWHPGLSVVLGDMTTGVSACFLDCQTDWVCINRVRMLNSNMDPATIGIVRHPDVGSYQFASCLPGSPIEPVFFGPGICVNSGFAPDTDPPVPVDVDVEDGLRLTLIFNEKIFEPDAEDLGSYLIYRMDGQGDTLYVNYASLQAEEDRVWMVLGGYLADTPYTMEIMGIRDVTGNAAIAGSHIEFIGFDTNSPAIETVYAPDDDSAVIVFSEPVTEASAEDLSNYTFRCTGTGCIAAPEPLSAVLQPDGISVIVTFRYPLAQNAEYYVKIENISDLAGNVMGGSIEVKFVPPDISPPYIVEVSANADTSLMIHWNEMVDNVSARDLSNYSFINNGPPAEPMTLIAVHYLGGTYNKLIFEPALEAEGEYTLFINGVMDISMNVMYPDTIGIIPADTIPPVMLDVACTGMRDIDLTFSESVDTRSWSPVPYNLQVYPLGDPESLLDIEGYSIFPGDTVIRLRFVSDMTVGEEYTVRAIDIRDFSGNSIPSQYLDFTCFDVYPPEVTGIFLPDLNNVNIQFNEAVNPAAAETASYVLTEEADSTAVVEIASAALYNGSTRAVLTMAAALVKGEIYTLKMSGVGDLLGNMIDPDTSWTFIAEETVAPVLIGLSVTSDSLVHMEFNEPLDPVTAEDVVRYAVVETVDTSIRLPLQAASLDSAGTTVDLEIDGRGKIGTLYAVWIMGITDIAGNALYAASGEFPFIDDIPPHLLSAVGATTRNVIVFFDEVITDATAGNEHNYSLYPAGDQMSEVDIFQANRLLDRMSVELVLGEDLAQDTDYTLEVAGIVDLAGNAITLAATEFHFLDVNPPVILDVDLLNPTRLSIEFSEPVDSVTASDTGNYSVYLASNSSQRITVTSIDWMTDEVRLNFASEPLPNLNYRVRIEGVEDRFGNACGELLWTFRYDVYAPSSKLYLFSDEYKSSQEIDVDHNQFFSFYIWVEPGGNGVYALEYALSVPMTYFATGVELNPAYVSVTLGGPYAGHSIGLSMCAQDWLWVARIDAFYHAVDEQEVVFFQPHPDTGVIQVATCLDGHPLEEVVAAYPLLINAEYVDILIDSWDVSFGRGGIELNWSILEAGSDPEFEVSRTPEGVDSWQRLDSDLIRGDDLRYTILDSDLEFGLSYRYRVEVVEDDGRKLLFETDAVATPVMPLVLRQNSPNPFNPSTSIGFFLPQPGHVRIEIFDVNGRQINVLADGHYSSGEHSVDWDGRDRTGSMVTSGVYFYRLTAGKESLSRKMVLLR